jgi:predicted DNA-binding transcriptional regulator YafY
MERLVAFDSLFRQQWHDRDPDRKFITGPELARRFEVSERTIRNDIQFMRDRLGLPCAYIPERRGYGYTEEVTSFPLSQITHGQLVLLAAGSRSLEGFPGAPFARHACDTFEKVVSVLGDSVSFNYHKVRSLISFRAGSYHSETDPRLFEQVCAALLDQEELRFTYTKLAESFDSSPPSLSSSTFGTPEPRRGHPRHLACIDGTWYLFTDDLDQRAPRKFALSRMTNLVRTGRRFTPAHPFDIDRALAAAFGAHTSGPSNRVHLRFHGISARIIAERHYHGTQSLTRNPDSTVDLVLDIVPGPELESWILGWDIGVEILEPQSLKDAIARKIQAMYRKLVDH